VENGEQRAYSANLAGFLTAATDRLGQMVERVLVLPRAEVPGGCDFSGVRRADGSALSELRERVIRAGRYLDRSVAEDAPDFKQLIPYVVVRDGARVFLMQRTDAGGDARLHGKASIGVGGHLNPVDEGEDALLAGLRREWTEELEAGWEPEFRLVGLLNDDSNPVGAVHLGVVFTVEADGRAVAVREHEKLTGAFVEADAVRAAWDRLETWSRLTAEALGLGRRPTGA
jgi:predicted NUDIX family phosphoesterase